MTTRRKKVIGILRDLGLFAAASLAQPYFMCASCTTVKYFQVALVTFSMWVFLWMGNSLLTHYVSSKISWVQFPVRRLIVGIVTTIAYTLVAILSLMTFFESVLNFSFGTGYEATIYFSIAITIVISLVLHSRAFLLSWRQATIDAEKLKRENMAARYESLKNQVNPHFLFNSFNALTNLVYEDQEKAVKFIKQLSEVYRYVLDTREKEVVPLEEEIRFLESYVYLQQIRFGNKLKIEISIKKENVFIAPLALQMLIENAIKHNIVSEEDPLTIKLYYQEDFIVVENNLQIKNIQVEASAGVGLENICQRYQFLSDQAVQVIQDKGSFIVKLPALNGKL